jgi:hypothetical protein
MMKHPLILEDTTSPIANAMRTILDQAMKLRGSGREDLARLMEANAFEVARHS